MVAPSFYKLDQAENKSAIGAASTTNLSLDQDYQNRIAVSHISQDQPISIQEDNELGWQYSRQTKTWHPRFYLLDNRVAVGRPKRPEYLALWKTRRHGNYEDSELSSAMPVCGLGSGECLGGSTSHDCLIPTVVRSCHNHRQTPNLSTPRNRKYALVK